MRWWWVVVGAAALKIASAILAPMGEGVRSGQTHEAGVQVRSSVQQVHTPQTEARLGFLCLKQHRDD